MDQPNQFQQQSQAVIPRDPIREYLSQDLLLGGRFWFPCEVPPNMRECSFQNFDLKEPSLELHLKACREYAASPVGSLVMLGKVGTGKTHLAVAIMRELYLRQRSTVLFVPYLSILKKQRSLYQRLDSEKRKEVEDWLDGIQNHPVVVFDGLEQGGGGLEESRNFYEIIEARTSWRRPSIFTANLPVPAFEELFGKPAWDRIRGSAYAILNFPTASRRRFVPHQ